MEHGNNLFNYGADFGASQTASGDSWSNKNITWADRAKFNCPQQDIGNNGLGNFLVKQLEDSSEGEEGSMKVRAPSPVFGTTIGNDWSMHNNLSSSPDELASAFREWQSLSSQTSIDQGVNSRWKRTDRQQWVTHESCENSQTEVKIEIKQDGQSKTIVLQN